MYLRKQVFEGLGGESAFLWGARQTGKSTLLRALFPESLYFDLLLNDEFERFQRNPSLLREIASAGDQPFPVIIDEVQKIPALLNEVHWLIENQSIRFILCGSSPRNILRTGGNLLGGRALRYELYPLVSSEIPKFDLLRAINFGMLPRIYQSQNPLQLLSAYIGSYLSDEIMAEARIRNISSFSRFLESAAFSNAEIVNFSNIAADCGVSTPTVKAYFQILEDTLIGRFLPSFQKKPKRRIIQAPKFFFFDVGIANFLLKRSKIEKGSEAFGKAFEHFIYQEIFAHSRYSGLNYAVSYWRTSTHLEVDFVLGEHQSAIEVKATDSSNARHTKGLRSFAEDYNVDKLILVTNDPYPRRIDKVFVLPWKMFLEQLWSGEIIS